MEPEERSRERRVKSFALHLSVVILFVTRNRTLSCCTRMLAGALAGTGIVYEVLIVDDGSTDGTFRLLTDVQRRDPRVRVIRFTRNFGQTAAFAAGFAAARGRFVATLDGDLQNDSSRHPASVLAGPEARHRVRMASGATRRVADAKGAIGHRQLADRRRERDASPRQRLLAQGVPRRHRQAAQSASGMHRYLPALAVPLGNGVFEEVVNHRPRRFGHSKYGLSRTFRVVADLVRLPTLKREAIDPRAPRHPLL
jgi:glycosyltransferase involved in cell wall biosynthesis